MLQRLLEDAPFAKPSTSQSAPTELPRQGDQALERPPTIGCNIASLEQLTEQYYLRRQLLAEATEEDAIDWRAQVQRDGKPDITCAPNYNAQHHPRADAQDDSAEWPAGEI